MISDAEKKLLAWALDCALTQRQKVGLLKMGSVMQAAQVALRDRQVQEKVLEVVKILSPSTADSIKEFLSLNKV